MTMREAIQDKLDRQAIVKSGRKPYPGLTPRQLEAVKHCADGMSLKQIAPAMKTGKSTVSRLLYQARVKLNIHDRVTLAHYALAHGLIKNKFTNPKPL